MQTTRRFAGPLAAAWPRLRDETAGDLLASPARSLPIPPAIDRLTWAAEHVHAQTIRDLRQRAEADLDTPWPVPLAHAYARYFRDGDRNGYERPVSDRQQRLSRAAVLAAVSLDPRWIDEVADGVILLCEQSGWCWAAHDDTRAVHGAVLPTVTDPYVDLGAGEVAAQLAWLDHLLGEQLDERYPGLRARIRYEVDRRVFTPFATRRDWHWLGLDGDVHNWSAWIHGNILVAAVRLVDDPQRRATLVDLAIEGLDRYVASIPLDGAIDEGYSYWWQGACRAIEALDVLDHATRGALGFPVDALRATVAFPHQLHLGGPWYLNHADGPARPRLTQPWDALHRAARRVKDPAAEAYAAAHRQSDAPLAHEELGLGRLLRAMTDPAWRAARPGQSPLPRDVWFSSTQVLLARPATGSPAGLTLGVKGGHNGEHHNHNDVGSVVVALNGVPVLIDAGRPTYTAQTFGPHRYDIWTMQSSWHNVPEIRGSAQGHGGQYTARDVSATIDDKHSELALDLAAAYPRTDIRHWWRTARLDRTTGQVTIIDRWQLDPAEAAAPVRIHLLAAGEVRTGAGHAEITALENAGTLALRWEPTDAPGACTTRKLDDPILSEVWGERLTRIDIDVTASGPEGTLVVTLQSLEAQ